MVGLDGWPPDGGRWERLGDEGGVFLGEEPLSELCKRLKVGSFSGHLPPPLAKLYHDVLSRLPAHWENDRVFWDEGRVCNARLVESPELAELDGRPIDIGTCSYLRTFRPKVGLLAEELRHLYGWDEEEEDAEDGEAMLKRLRHGPPGPRHSTPFGTLSHSGSQWWLAHTLAHLALTPLDPSRSDPATLRERDEDDADTLAIAWGFTEELEAFLGEVERDTWF